MNRCGRIKVQKCQKCQARNMCQKYKDYLKAQVIYEHNKLAKRKGYL